MDLRHGLRATVLSTIIRDTPKEFWEAARTGARQTYLDVFHQVHADPNAVGEQRLDKLYQDRHFRMEHLLATLASNHGLVSSSTVLVDNNRSYVYVTGGSIGLTQAYVPTIGSMPKPARFRERHAAVNNIPKTVGFDFGLEPREVLVGKEFYGILAHNPAGKRFNEEDQKLGMLQFCVPTNDCSEWAAELTIEEIVSSYATTAPTKEADRHLQWKKRDEEKGTGS